MRLRATLETGVTITQMKRVGTTSCYHILSRPDAVHYHFYKPHNSHRYCTLQGTSMGGSCDLVRWKHTRQHRVCDPGPSGFRFYREYTQSLRI